MESIVLASASQRRQDILRDQGIPFMVVAPSIDERTRDYLPPKDRALFLAKEKADDVCHRLDAVSPRFVLAADTLIVLPTSNVKIIGYARAIPFESGPHDSIVLGKPENQHEAHWMIRLLAGTRHRVVTAIHLINRKNGESWSGTSDSSVDFAPMDDGEIASYISSNEWEGAAGGYRIQGLAARFISSISGSWSGIVGLPIHELYVILRRAGIELGV